jgi:sugar transferase (PEP-CTERM system associated)
MTIRLFSHYVPTPLFLLAIVELTILFASVYLGVTVRFAEIDTQFYVQGAGPISIYPRALMFTAVMMSVMTAFGLYRWDMRKDDSGYRTRYLGSFAVGVLAMMVVFYAVPQMFVGRGILALTFVFSFFGTAVARFIFFRVVGNEALRRRVLVLGSGNRAAEVDALLRQLGEHARFQIIGFVSMKNEHPSVDRGKIIHDKGSLLALAHRYSADEVVVGVRDRRGGHLSMPELLECKLDGINVIDLSSFFERETGYVQLDSLNISWMVFSEGFRRNAWRNVVKRAFDIVISGLLFILTLPIMLLTALAIFIETGRPIFYSQERVGECGQSFPMLKFRSMRVDAEKDGVARWAAKNDNRVTRVGQFIRLTRIDELPQILNVLNGDMSFVGPRPERPQFVRELVKQIPYYASRHSVKPGITGWAQIRYPYGASLDDAAKKLQFDLYYVKNHTLFLDLIVLFQTAQVVLFGRGAR